MIEHRPTGDRPIPIRRVVIATAAATAIALALAKPAHGGVYRVAQCHAAYSVAHPDARFTRTSDHYRSDAACGESGDGLTVRHRGQTTNDGRLGAWTVSAPSGARVVAFSANLAGEAQSGHRPELIVGLGSTVREAGTASGNRHWVNWSGSPASYLAARLRCARGGGCGEGERAFVAIRRMILSLDDLVSPRVGATGTLVGGGPRRGTHTLGAVASDAGSGVRRIDVRVNGAVLDSRAFECATRNDVAVRVSPCPGGGSTSRSVDTGKGPFRHGDNEIVACARDYASVVSTARRTCERRTVRVDRLCPRAGAGGGSALNVQVRRRGSGGEIRGTLRDAAGNPVRGARICVATRVPVRGHRERLAATPVTSADGRFRAALRPGPSRAVRVAYWADDGRAIERTAQLRIPARPQLRLRPRRQLQNGDRLRFALDLPGPAAAGRQVKIQAASNGRWLDLRSGRTGAGGRYGARYRFRATTARRTYRFRAVVRRQHGYPYEAGRSRVRRVTVRG